MTSQTIKKTRNIIKEIMLDSLLVSILLVIALGIFYKFNNKAFYFYNTRYDVVLTDSMSKKNEKYEEFLEGHDQIQAFDFVVSEKVTENTKLDVYDVVVFYNDRLKADDMHRIVDIKDVGDGFDFKKLQPETFHSHDTFVFKEVISDIFTKGTVSYRYIEAVLYTEEPYNGGEYYFNVDDVEVPVSIESELVGDIYKNTVTYDKKDSTSAFFSVTKKNYDFTAHFESIRIYDENKECKITSSILNGNDYQTYLFNIGQRYMIRGDKANTDDGWFEKYQIKTKVNLVIPKLGYGIRFLSSPWGVLLVVGLIALIMVFTHLLRKENKKGATNEKK